MVNFWWSKKTIDYCVLFLISFISLGYILWGSDFAELRISLPSIPFPIFIGEITLFLCWFLFFLKYRFSFKSLTRLQWFAVTYVIFVFSKALTGYFEWGPLAFRHSALFYYPSFFVFGYCFYRNDLLKNGKNIILLGLLALGFICNMYGNWLLTGCLLFFALIKTLKNKFVRYGLFVAVLFLIPYKDFIDTSRMMILGNIVSALFLAVCFAFFLKCRWQIRLIIGFFSVCIISFLVVKSFDTSVAVKSIFSFNKIKETFNYYDREISSKMYSSVVEKRGQAKIYNPNDKRVKMKSQQLLVKKSDKSVAANVQEERRQQDKKQLSPVSEENQNVTAEEEQTLLTGESLGTVGVSRANDQQDKKQLSPVSEENQNVTAEEEQTLLTGESLGTVGVSRANDQQDKKQLSPVSEENQNVTADADPYNQRNLIQVRLYNPNKKDVKEARKQEFLTRESSEAVSLNGEGRWQNKEQLAALSKKNRSFSGANINSVFRIFIWRDMLVEMIRDKPIFGFDFGKPLRSPSLEILRWGESEWQRDGWIGAHNSWLYIIYCAGIVGIVLIAFIFSLLIRMVIFYVRKRSFVGICLSAIAVNWFVAANFLLILELPYTAIPIWSIFGLNYAYYKNLKNSLGCNRERIKFQN